jgi:hypothetical protein
MESRILANQDNKKEYCENENTGEKINDPWFLSTEISNKNILSLFAQSNSMWYSIINLHTKNKHKTKWNPPTPLTQTHPPHLNLGNVSTRFLDPLPKIIILN